MLLVQGIGVRQVLGEARRRLRMTLPAGVDDVGFRQVRGRVRRRQHVVMAVAVVTGGDRRRDVRFAQRHRLAVVGFLVMGEPVLMTTAAAFIAHQLLEVPALRRLDLVRRMAITANRPARIALGEQLAVDALLVNLLDADVAFAAGLGDVGVVDGRTAIDAALDVVDAVAIVAGGRDDQPHLQQRPPMNALGVLRRRFRVLHPVFTGQAGIAVALGAGLRQVQLEHRRRRVLHRQDVVMPVAILAVRRRRSAHRPADAVDAGRVLLADLIVARSAIDRRQLVGMRHLLDVGMAGGAVLGAMHRLGEHVHTDEERPTFGDWRSLPSRGKPSRLRWSPRPPLLLGTRGAHPEHLLQPTL